MRFLAMAIDLPNKPKVVAVVGMHELQHIPSPAWLALAYNRTGCSQCSADVTALAGIELQDPDRRRPQQYLQVLLRGHQPRCKVSLWLASVRALGCGPPLPPSNRPVRAMAIMPI